MELVARYAIAIGISSLVMAWLGPAGSLELMSATNRSLFWLVAMTFGWLQMMIIARGFRSVIGADRLPGWAILAMVVVVGAVPLTFEVRALWAQLRTVPGDPAPLYVAYTTTLLINLLFCLIMWSFVERWPLMAQPHTKHPGHRNEDGPDTGASSIPTVSRLKRRPEGLSGPILSLASEDHYLRVTTPGGDGLVLCRLSDAIADLERADGLQVHRSWWVSRHAVERVSSSRGKRELVLTNGQTVPIGRAFVGELRRAGWL